MVVSVTLPRAVGARGPGPTDAQLQSIVTPTVDAAVAGKANIDGSNAEAASFRSAIGADVAANVFYSPEADGSSGRSLQSKASDTLSLADFAPAGDGATSDTKALLDFFASSGSLIPDPKVSYFTATNIRPPVGNLRFVMDANAEITGGGMLDLRNVIPFIPNNVSSRDLYSKTYGEESRGPRNLFQRASVVRSNVTRGGTPYGPAVVALFGAGIGDAVNSAVWGINLVGYANASGAVAIANETDSGPLVEDGIAFNTVLVSTGYFPSENAIQVQANRDTASFKNGFVFNNRAVTSAPSPGEEPVVTDITAVTGALILADAGGTSQRFIRSQMTHTISEWESPNLVVGPTYVPTGGLAQNRMRIDVTANGAYMRANNAADAVTPLYLGSCGAASIQFLTGKIGSGGEVSQVEVRHTASATDRLRLTGGIGDVQIDAVGNSTNSSVSIAGKGNGGVKMRDGAGALKFQLNTTGVGFFAATPVSQRTAPAALPTDGSATSAQMATAINALRAGLISLGLFV